MSRVTDPICTHARRGIVTSHPPKVRLFDAVELGAHAATNVCDRPECIEDAKFWVRAISGKEPHHAPDGAR